MILIKNYRLRSPCVLGISLDISKIRTAIIASTAIFALFAVAGCGQKGDLYLVDNSSAATATVQPASAAIDSGSQPQDTAFAGLNDDEPNHTSNSHTP